MPTVRLGRIDESFYQVVGGVVADVLRRDGHDVVVSEGSHTEIYDALGDGRLDVAVAFWLPDGHAAAWKRLGTNVVELATLYTGAEFFWAVPAYVDARIKSIADLADAELSRDFPRVIRGLSLDATITTASAQAISAYGLDALDYRLEAGGFAAWEASLETAVSKQQPVVLPLWTPYYLNAVYELRTLTDPKLVLGRTNRVVLGARSGAAALIGEASVAALRSTGLTLATVSELDRRIHVERRTPDEVAREWLSGVAR